MSCSPNRMFNDSESNTFMQTTVVLGKCPIKDYGNLPLAFRSSSGDITLLLCNVAHETSRSCQRLPLRAITDKGHTFFGDRERITLHFSSGETLRFPSTGRLDFLYVYQPGMTVNDVIAPTPMPSRHTAIDIDDFHVPDVHAHEGVLWKTAK